jgi:CHAT domain-containing protein
MYLAIMRVYADEEVPKTEFTEPLAVLEQRQLWPDVFFGQLGLLERTCIQGRQQLSDCRDLAPVLARAEALAHRIGDPSLIRLAIIARMRWSAQVLSTSEANRVGKGLDALPGEPPEWLRLLEASTRIQLARQLGDDTKIRQIYVGLLSVSTPGSMSHTAALAGVAAVTAQMALGGLADRGEAERLLRSALEAQRKQELFAYNAIEIGTEGTKAALATLLGRTTETLSFLSPGDDSPLAVELLLQGNAQDRVRAIQLARQGAGRKDPRWPATNLAVAHAELVAGSASEGIRWGERTIQLLERWREDEDDDGIRMRADASRGLLYQIYISDLLDRAPTDPVHLAKAWETLERLRARVLLDRLLVRERRDEPRPEAIATIEDVQALLTGDEALVSFFVWSPRTTPLSPYSRGHSYALVVTRGTMRAVRIPQGEELEPAVKAWTGLLDHRNGAIGPGTRRLYEGLMKPVLDVLPAGVHALVLVPDGPLHRLPFDALSETGGAPYLADRYAISIVPSASVWTRLRRRPALPPGVALAFANTPEGPAVPVAETRGEVEPGQLFALIHAREEALEAVHSFPVGSRLFAGAEATPEHLLGEQLHRASLVHFAAHGVVDEREPDQSFLLLAPGASGSGVLKVADVPRFDWTGRTVVLSACNTSVGAFRIGEGVLSLARGFFAGGASAVIGTLSKVRDDDQRALFHAFYAELRRGLSVGESMAKAKRALIQTGAPPAAWANVVVMGDATVRPREAERSLLPQAGLMAGGTLAALVTITLAIRGRRRRATSA